MGGDLTNRNAKPSLTTRRDLPEPGVWSGCQNAESNWLPKMTRGGPGIFLQMTSPRDTILCTWYMVRYTGGQMLPHPRGCSVCRTIDGADFGEGGPWSLMERTRGTRADCVDSTE